MDMDFKSLCGSFCEASTPREGDVECDDMNLDLDEYLNSSEFFYPQWEGNGLSTSSKFNSVPALPRTIPNGHRKASHAYTHRNNAHGTVRNTMVNSNFLPYSPSENFGTNVNANAYNYSYVSASEPGMWSNSNVHGTGFGPRYQPLPQQQYMTNATGNSKYEHEFDYERTDTTFSPRVQQSQTAFRYNKGASPVASTAYTSSSSLDTFLSENDTDDEFEFEKLVKKTNSKKANIFAVTEENIKPAKKAKVEEKFTKEGEEGFVFEDVCAVLSEQTNTFLSDTYIKGLLGVSLFTSVNSNKSNSKNRKSENKEKQQATAANTLFIDESDTTSTVTKKTTDNKNHATTEEKKVKQNNNSNKLRKRKQTNELGNDENIKRFRNLFAKKISN